MMLILSCQASTSLHSGRVYQTRRGHDLTGSRASGLRSRRGLTGLWTAGKGDTQAGPRYSPLPSASRRA